MTHGTGILAQDTFRTNRTYPCSPSRRSPSSSAISTRLYPPSDGQAARSRRPSRRSISVGHCYYVPRSTARVMSASHALQPSGCRSRRLMNAWTEVNGDISAGLRSRLVLKASEMTAKCDEALASTSTSSTLMLRAEINSLGHASDWFSVRCQSPPSQFRFSSQRVNCLSKVGGCPRYKHACAKPVKHLLDIQITTDQFAQRCGIVLHSSLRPATGALIPAVANREVSFFSTFLRSPIFRQPIVISAVKSHHPGKCIVAMLCMVCGETGVDVY